MANSHQFLLAKNKRVACSNELSFIVVVCKHLIQWHIPTGAQLNEDHVCIYLYGSVTVVGYRVGWGYSERYFINPTVSL